MYTHIGIHTYIKICDTHKIVKIKFVDRLLSFVANFFVID